MHFERMADDYATARPPYPAALFETLMTLRVIGPGLEVVEVGAGAGLATRDLVAAGSHVTAVEPGSRLAARLRRDVPAAEVIVGRLEDIDLCAGSFDAAVAATSLHWVDLDVGLPILHRALRPRGWLAVWRTVFGDDDVEPTPFRRRVTRIVAARPAARRADPGRETRPTVEELTADGRFTHVDTRRWRWSSELSTAQIRSLFATFSDWSPAEVDAAATAADECGGVVTEHRVLVLHLLRTTVPTVPTVPTEAG